MFLDSANLVFIMSFLSENKQTPSGFMSFFDFHVKIAMAEAVTSFRHRSHAFARTTSERTLSESLILVIERAVDLIDLFISSVRVIEPVSS